MMKKIFLSLLLVIGTTLATTAELEDILQLDGAISDISISGEKAYVATERGKVQIIDLKTHKIINEISYPKFEDFMGELQLPKVFSVDVSPDQKLIAAAVQATRGGREVYIYHDGKLTKIIDRKKHFPIAKLRFVDNQHLIFGLTGDEIILFDLKNNKVIYRNPVGMSFFSDMEINESKTKIALTDESGDTRIIDIKSGKVVKVIEELNKDKAFDVDFKNNRTFTGGRDKKAVYYNLNTNQYQIFDADDFMVFSVGLSPSGKRGAYVYNDKFNVKVVNTEEGTTITYLKGHKSTPSNIRFLSEEKLIIGCDDGKIFFWRLKQ
ncbi:hypothetical protein [Persephonella sp. IF05-L8]|uniref:hypothetical protein n=1 Tax=Persephonella sp. IF05-L8 TaxID=1158338 RepID=UPI0012DF899D